MTDIHFFPVWLFAEDGSVVELLAEPGAGFTVRMYPEQIAALEKTFKVKLEKIATDTKDNVIWRKR